MITGRKIGESGVQDVVARGEVVALVNRYALRELRPDQVGIYEAEACNELLDRDQEVFSRELLDDFRDTLPGKSLLMGHAWGDVGIGRVIAARIDDSAGYWRLMATFYLLKETDGALCAKLDGGVAWAVSIGFYAPSRVVGQDDDGRTIGVYERGPNGERGEALELSLVFLGAQYNAEVLSAKSAGRKDRCGRDALTCEIEADVLQRSLWAVKELQDQCRFDRPGRPRRLDLSLVELAQKRAALETQLLTACRGRR
jgi:hypothetical protein